MLDESKEYSFEDKRVQAAYDKERAAGEPPKVAALEAIRRVHKGIKNQIKGLEDSAETLKNRAKEIANGEPVELPGGSFQPNVAGGGKSVDYDRFEDERPDLYDRYVSTYSYTYSRFYNSE